MNVFVEYIYCPKPCATLSKSNIYSLYGLNWNSMVRQPEFFVELQFFSYLKTCIVSDTILKGKICMLTHVENVVYCVLIHVHF